MFLVSWNCASWKKTIEHINTNHAPKQIKDSTLKGSTTVNVTKARTGLDLWLSQLQADIFCLQEVKIDRSRVESLAAQIGARSSEYDAFFACPGSISTNSSHNSLNTTTQTSGGLNGVATFVRKTHTLRASAWELDGGGELDREGRCIMTDHGNVVLFNVYIPNSQGGARLAFKQKFQQALKIAMQRQRMAGKSCILLGDFNLHYRAEDVCIKYRLLCMDKLLYSDLSIEQPHPGKSILQTVPAHAYLPDLVRHIRNQWPAVSQALRDSLVVDIEELDIASHTGKPASASALTKIAKLRVKHPTRHVSVLLRQEKFRGDMNNAYIDEFMRRDYSLLGQWVNAATGRVCLFPTAPISTGLSSTNTSDTECNRPILAEKYIDDMTSAPEFYPMRLAGRISVYDLQKACTLLGGESFNLPNSATNQKITEEMMWEVLGEVYGEPCSAICDRDWMLSLLQGGHHSSGSDNVNDIVIPAMVDTFAVTRPNACDRFTCWDQYTNERYRNEGARIDYILVDQPLWDKYGAAGGALDGYLKEHKASVPIANTIQRFTNNDSDVTTMPSTWITERTASLAAATNFGAFQQAPFDGGGLQRAANWAYDSHLRLLLPSGDMTEAEQRKHTGIIYTPPEYSDHVAVSAVFNRNWVVAHGETDIPLLQLSKDEMTKFTQPHAKQATLGAFFGLVRADQQHGSLQCTHSKNLSQGNTSKMCTDVHTTTTANVNHGTNKEHDEEQTSSKQKMKSAEQSSGKEGKVRTTSAMANFFAGTALLKKQKK